MDKGLSVIIPNYNGTPLFPQTLPGVYKALKISGLPYEVIVADDCSTDNSIEYLSQNFPEIKVVVNKKNSGFSITANNGIRSAKYNLVLLLNSDVKLDPDYFIHQLKYFEQEETFGVMGRITGWNDDQIQDAAKYPSFHSAKIKTSVNYFLKDEPQMGNGLYTSYLSGANALLDRKKLELLGGFNEIFSPFYVEDYELSLRAWRMGWKCYYDHSSVCHHHASITIKSKSRKSYIKMIYNRNKWFLHAIHLSSGKRLLWFIQLIPEIIGQSLILKIYYLKAFYLFLKNYKLVRASRLKLQKIAGDKKLLSVNEVAAFIQSSVKNKEVLFF